MMSGLRWTLGVSLGFVAAAALAIAIIGGGFRSSFGASDKGPWVELVIVVSTGLLLASLMNPTQRTLLHVTAAVVAAAIIGCIMLMREAPLVATLSLAWAAGWIAYYWRATHA